MIDFAKEGKIFDQCVFHLEDELKNIRTGRAHVSMIEHITVDVHGVLMPLPHVAALSTPDSHSIVIKPWDKTLTSVIEQAIIKSNIGFSPVAEQDQIRLVLPALTEERRKELVKIAGKYTEDARITVRRCRDDMWKRIQEEEREGIISEDQKYFQKEHMEKLVESANKKIAHILQKKEKDILEI